MPSTTMTVDCGPRALRRTLALAGALVAYAPLACASYDQMSLPGLGAMMLLALLVVYALVVDLVLLLQGFRLKTLVVVNTIAVLAWAIALAVDRASLAALLENIAREWEATLLGVAIALLPTVLLLEAPLLQHVELRRGPSRRAAYAAITLQCVLAATWLAGDCPRAGDRDQAIRSQVLCFDDASAQPGASHCRLGAARQGS